MVYVIKLTFLNTLQLFVQFRAYRTRLRAVIVSLARTSIDNLSDRRNHCRSSAGCHFLEFRQLGNRDMTLLDLHAHILR